MDQKLNLLFTLIVFVVLSLPFPGIAQFDLGIKAGMNMGEIKVRSENLLVDEQYAPLRLWHLGLTGTFDLSEKISAQTELLFNQKGGQSPIDLNMPNPLEAYWQYKISYLSVPVLLQYKAGPLTFEAGPELGYLVNMRTLRNDVPVDNDLSFLGDQAFELAMCAGFKFRVERFFTEVRWGRGLLSMGQVVFHDNNGEVIGHYDHYSHTLQVSFGYYLFTADDAGKKGESGNLVFFR